MAHSQKQRLVLLPQGLQGIPLLLLLLLLPQRAIIVDAKTYNVGGLNAIWTTSTDALFYQTWSNSISWYSGDTLSFNYDKSSHNVWAFQDQASYLLCDFSGRNRLDSDTYSLVTILPWTPGSYGFIYFGSSIGLDCINGMRFFVSYYTCATCAGSTSAPPPPVELDSPPPPLELPPPPVELDPPPPVELDPPPPPVLDPPPLDPPPPVEIDPPPPPVELDHPPPPVELDPPPPPPVLDPPPPPELDPPPPPVEIDPPPPPVELDPPPPPPELDPPPPPPLELDPPPPPVELDPPPPSVELDPPPPPELNPPPAPGTQDVRVPPPPSLRDVPVSSSPPEARSNGTLAAPPPLLTSTNMSRSEGVLQTEGKKTTSHPAAIAVPVVVVFLLVAGNVVFCYIRRTREQAVAAPPVISPSGGSPLPAIEKIKIPAAAALYVPGSMSNNSSSDSKPGKSSSTVELSSSSQGSNKPGFFGPPPGPAFFASSSRGSSSSSGSRRARMGVDASRVFTYGELCAATTDFSNRIGTGGFGVVYKGVLPDGVLVAVKCTRHSDKAEDKNQLLNEAALLSRAKHKNLVRLLGYCAREDVGHGQQQGGRHGASDSVVELMLVCEFVPNGTLENHLAGSRKGYPTMDWAGRMKVAVQIADALNYLHVHVTPPIIHRDVRSANILLDAHWNAKVADFGLSKLKEDEGATHVSTDVKGTRGYLDPEYAQKGHLTDKSDVYGLGVVLLELLTARRAMDPDREHTLAATVVPLILENRVREILDHQLLTSLTSQAMLDPIERVAQVAVVCLLQDSASRPTMTEVVEMLQMIKGSSLRPEKFLARAKSQGGPIAPGFNVGRSRPGGSEFSGSSTSHKTGTSWSTSNDSKARAKRQSGPTAPGFNVDTRSD